MQLMKKIVNGLNIPFLKISAILILLMMFITVADVAGRYFFNRPILGVFELTRFGLGAIVCAALGFSQINKVHIAINIFVSRLPLGWQNIIETFNYLVAFITFAIVSWQMFAYTGRLYISAQVTSVLGVSIYPFVLISALGVVLFTLVLLWDLVKAIYKLFSRGVEDEYSTHWNS
ncbi:MAG TPA: TRAP transporter small permease [Firmicutes bacterium]|jgi:TRAP-type C4-dicarboxylate transport system permease small subunit|nr:TRAP transporter small permease [Bacillota bacterium]